MIRVEMSGMIHIPQVETIGATGLRLMISAVLTRMNPEVMG